jgi:hypothetical protein
MIFLLPRVESANLQLSSHASERILRNGDRSVSDGLSKREKKSANRLITTLLQSTCLVALITDSNFLPRSLCRREAREVHPQFSEERERESWWCRSDDCLCRKRCASLVK